MPDLPAPWLDKVGVNGFQPGSNTTALVQNLSELTECFANYRQEQECKGQPLDLYTWFSYGARHLGIGRRWWGRIMRDDKNAPKLPGLKEVCSMIEDVIAGHLSSEALQNNLHPGLVAQQLKTMEDRDVLSDQRETATERAKPVDSAMNEEHLAVHIHPDDDQPLNLPRPVYSRAQIKAGIPFTPPPHDLTADPPNNQPAER